MPVNDRIRLRRNPPNVAVPQGFDDLYFNSAGELVHESADGTSEVVGSGGTEEAQNHLTFDTTPTAVPTTEGTVSWNEDDHTLDIQTEVANTRIQVGQENVVRVRNSTGATLTDGMAVYITGATGQRATVAKAIASNATHVKSTIGLVTSDISNNGNGYVTTQGLVRGVNTAAFAEGATLYLSDSVAGSITDTAPTTNDVVRIGWCVVSGNNGTILVSVQRMVSNVAVNAAIAENPSSSRSSLQLVGVRVTKKDGTFRHYAPSADTDAARGLALEAAFSAAVAGDTIDLAPGNYDVAKATSTVIAVATHYAILAGMTIRLNGARLYHGASFNGAVFFGADAVDGWSILGPGVIEGTAATSSGSNEVGINTRTSRRWLIKDLTVRYFKNTGIQANSSSYTSGDYSTGKVSTGKIVSCNIDLNNIGFACYSASEYISLIGCTFNKNLTGCDIYAGNTRFLGCEATYNTNYALRIRDGGNDGHGIWNGGSINHNSGFAVAVEANMDNGFTFTGAHFYADSTTTNKIQSLGGGLTFVGCIIDSPFYASATPSGINSVIGSHFPVATVSAANAVADLSSAERLKWVFENNYSLTGGYANNDTQVYVFADNTAALAGGLTAGRRYRQTTTNLVAEVV